MKKIFGFILLGLALLFGVPTFLRILSLCRKFIAGETILGLHGYIGDGAFFIAAIVVGLIAKNLIGKSDISIKQQKIMPTSDRSTAKMIFGLILLGFSLFFGIPTFLSILSLGMKFVEREAILGGRGYIVDAVVLLLAIIAGIIASKLIEKSNIIRKH